MAMRFLKGFLPFVLELIVGVLLYRAVHLRPVIQPIMLDDDCVGCSGNVIPPVIRVLPPMRLTEAARKARAKGVARVQVTLNDLGTVYNAQRLSEIPFGLASEAEIAARGVRAEPAKNDEDGLFEWSNIEVEYKFDAASNEVESQCWYNTDPPSKPILLTIKK